LLLRIGAAKKEVGRAFGLVKIHVPETGQAVTRQTFHFHLDKAAVLEDKKLTKIKTTICVLGRWGYIISSTML